MNRAYWWLVVLAMVSFLQGCAGGAQTLDGRRDLVTESDEPEARKRARVRLELAAGYYEQGQLTVALDEVKQSLQIDPSYADAFNLRALVYMRLNEPRLAESSFQEALRRNPGSGDFLHNLAFLYCTQARYDESFVVFNEALKTPNYQQVSKTWMMLGLCQARAGRVQDAERSLSRSFELDAGNPITLYNLSLLLHQRGESERARFFMRRLNNSEQANAESLWLGIKIENRLQNREAARQLGDQLKRRFPESREAGAYERGAFNE